MTFGPFEWMSSDEVMRPTFWIALPHGYVVFVLGWERPRMVWL